MLNSSNEFTRHLDIIIKYNATRADRPLAIVVIYHRSAMLIVEAEGIQYHQIPMAN